MEYTVQNLYKEALGSVSRLTIENNKIKKEIAIKNEAIFKMENIIVQMSNEISMFEYVKDVIFAEGLSDSYKVALINKHFGGKNETK